MYVLNVPGIAVQPEVGPNWYYPMQLHREPNYPNYEQNTALIDFDNDGIL